VNESLRRVAELLLERTGIVISQAQLPGLAAALGRTSPGLTAQGFLGSMDRPEGEELLARLVDEVTVKETYFFRALSELQAVDWRALQRSAQARGSREVRVWVSACATGEEAYSLAILATAALGQAPRVSILATDISGAAVAGAEAACYSERSVRDVPADARERWFARHGRCFVLDSSIRALVRFEQHNLVLDPAPPPAAAFDLVACRNVLIYFGPATVAHVLTTITSAVAPGGQLVLGAADLVAGNARRLGPVAFATTSEPRRRRELGRTDAGPAGWAPARSAPFRASGAVPTIVDALRAADAGDLETTIALTAEILAEEPLNADAHFVRGLAELGNGAEAVAVTSFRRALYLDPSFGLAAFQLGRAHDALGNQKAGRRAYEQALGALDPDDGRHRDILGQVDLADVAHACRVRLTAGPARA
jgi:chemotaxis methyl-accepting protein methylase